MLYLLFSLGSRKLDDWLPATTTSCTWEVVFSPIPTYYFPFPSYASGQPASFFSLLVFGASCVGLSVFHSGWDQIGPIQMLPLKIVCRGQIGLLEPGPHLVRLMAFCELIGMTVMLCKVNVPIQTHTHSHPLIPPVRACLVNLAQSEWSAHGLEQPTCHYVNILQDYSPLARI